MKIKQRTIKIFCLLLMTAIIIQCFSPALVMAAKFPSINRQNLTLFLNTSDPDAYTSHYYLKINNAPSRPIWSSSNSKIVTVNKYGTVVAKSKGKANITATMGKTKLTCKVSVTAEPKDSSLEKAVKVETEIVDGYCCFTFTSTSSYYLEVDVYANEYDSNGDKNQFLFTNVHTYLSGKGTYQYYYKLYETTKYVDIEKVDIKLANNFQEPKNSFFTNMRIKEIVKLKGVSASVGNLEYDSFFNINQIPYEIVNNTAFPVSVSYQFIFYKGGKIVYVDSIFSKEVGAHSKINDSLGIWGVGPSDMFKDEEGVYSYDKCEIIPLYTTREFESND